MLLLTLMVSPAVDASLLPADFDMVFGMFKEFFIGFCCGFVYQIFYYLLLFAGSIMDTEFGMAMAKVFDPSTNMQTSVTGSIMTALFAIYIMLTDSHLVMIQLYAISFKLVPIGTISISPDCFKLMLELFVSVFSLVFRLLLPFVVVEFALQVVLGIMMKLVPQIHIFVINFHLKMGMGLILLILLTPSIAAFMDNYIVIMLENIQRTMLAFA